MYLWNTPRLAEDLAAERVSERDKMLYLLVGTIAYIIFNYLPLVPTELTPLYWTEFGLVMVIAAVGIFKCYQNNGGPRGERLLEYFLCLSVPLFIKITIICWGAYAAFFWSTGPFVKDMPEETYPVLYRLYELLTLGTVTLTQVLYYSRMWVHIGRIHSGRAGRTVGTALP